MFHLVNSKQVILQNGQILFQIFFCLFCFATRIQNRRGNPVTEIYRKTSFRVKLQDLGAKMSRFCCRMCAFLHLRCARYINS